MVIRSALPVWSRLGRAVLAVARPPESSRSAGGADTRPEIELLLAAARVHLEDDDAERLRARLRSDLDWDYLLRMARRNGVTALARAAPQCGRPGQSSPRRSWISSASPRSN